MADMLLFCENYRSHSGNEKKNKISPRKDYLLDSKFFFTLSTFLNKNWYADYNKAMTSLALVTKAKPSVQYKFDSYLR